VDEHQSFLEDDEDDTLLFDKLQEHALEANPNPERIGCLDRATLKAWVFTPEKLNLTDPKYLHVLKCAECTRELIELRQLRNEQSARARIGVLARSSSAMNWRSAVFASVVLFGLAVAGVIYWRTHSEAAPPQVAQSTPVAVTIDLSHAGTTRGSDTSTVPVGVLPRRVVTAHVILPNFSPGGNYVISVTTDRNGTAEKANGRAVANAQGFHADLTVTLDLRVLPPGTYFLATTHEGDPASYFYPLTVR
jgi:hypothetical protein